MLGLILAGGEGTRLARDGIPGPKAMVEVAGRPLLFRLHDALREAGCETVWCALRRSALGALSSAGRSLPPGLRVVPCETPSSLHTLVEGLAHIPTGPVLCAMVDTVMPAEDWRRVGETARSSSARAADGCIVVTGFVDDERPLYVSLRPDGMVAAFGEEPSTPVLVTGGVYLLGLRARALASPLLAVGVERMRGYLGALARLGHRLETVEVDRIVDVDRSSDLALASTWLADGESPPQPISRGAHP